MTNKCLNIGIWSVGKHALRNIFPAIALSPSIDLKGVYTRNKATRSTIAKAYQCEIFENKEQLLSSESIDAIYISSPNGTHYEQIKQCLENNKAVLVEKTALPSLYETKEIVALAKTRNLLVMEAFMYRFHCQFRRLKELLASEKYGKTLKVNCEFGFPHLAETDIRYSADLKGGALLDAGAYTLSASRNILGNQTVVKGAVIETEAEFTVDTKGFALLHSADASSAQCSWAFGGSYINEIRIWCEHAHLIVKRAFSKPPELDSEIEVWSNGDLVETVVTGPDNHFINMFEYFASQVFKQNQFELEELLYQSQIMEAIKNKAQFES